MIKSADWLVSGSSSLAKTFGIPSIIIGLTIVAFGTSAPEWIVTVFSSFSGFGNAAIGNVIGSNISNVALILGVAAIILPLSVDSKVISREIPFLILASLVMFLMVTRGFFSGEALLTLFRSDGLILIAFFSIFLYYLINEALRSGESFIEERRLKGEYADIAKNRKPLRAIGAFLIGVIGLALAGQLVVHGGVNLAGLLGISDAVVGLFAFSLGTSLPELVTTIKAVREKEPNLAIGNVVGSNVFNTLFVLGSAASITPIVYSSKLLFDVGLMFALSGILMFFSFTDRKISRVEGISLLVLYFLYLTFLFVRN